MINERQAKRYCRDDIANIENYNKALSDRINMWHCHHRDEVKLLPSGIKVYRSAEDLKECGRYYNCPANELIFLTQAEHNKLHKKSKSISEEHRMKISKTMKGRTFSLEHRRKLSEAELGNKRNLGKHHSEETRRKIREGNKGQTHSEFGKNFKEHYGLTKTDNTKLYQIEYDWYRRHNKTYRWEMENEQTNT